jgi:hypothetical protein
MPTILRSGSFQFIVFTSDHPPAHVHVRGSGHLAKIRLDPVTVERDGGFSAGELRRILDIVEQNQDQLLAEWDKYYPER